jgi:probable F420-dependent oxidoreductase
VRFCFSAAFSPAGDLPAIAKAGDETGWDTLTIPDHLINPVETRSTYPYTADGGRRWEMGTEWPDPWVTIAHLAGMTERLRFLTTVYILPARTPVHVAKQVGTAAVLSGDRVGLGIGMGWMEEEFDAMGVPFAKRGRRADEMLEVLRKLWTGEVVEHHGEHFDVPPLELLPAPAAPIGIHVGGTSEAALRRAARNDGWVSDLQTTEELAGFCEKLRGYREELGRADEPFAVVAACKDAWDLDGYRRLHDVGVTHLLTQPWMFYGGDTTDLDARIDGIARFGEDVIGRW